MEDIFSTIGEVINSHQEQTAKAEHNHRQNPISTVKTDWHKESEEISSNGCERFGWDWIRANESAISVADNFGVNYEHPQIKAFMQGIVFAVLDRSRTA